MTLFETQIAELQSSYEHTRAATLTEQAEKVLDTYIRAVETRHRKNCRALVNGAQEWCSCSRAHIVREATARYRQSVEQIRRLRRS